MRAFKVLVDQHKKLVVHMVGKVLDIAAVAFMNKTWVTELLNFIWKERWIGLYCITLFLSVQISDKLVKKYVLYDHHPLP